MSDIMSPERHKKLRQLFDEALERPEAERHLFLSKVCGADSDLLQSVLNLLEAHKRSQSFLATVTSGPQRVGRYVITDELGSGAMGVVYRAIDPLIGSRSVAVKVIHLKSARDSAEADRMREALFREARAAGVLSHPNIVTVYDVGTHENSPFIAMEFVDGSSLYQVLQSNRIMERFAATRILRQAASALDYAHAAGVIHRDIKPANLMINRSGAVKITDFGIAKVGSTKFRTATGLIMGTPGYMSPEQLQSHHLNGNSDQFALATMAFELLTGARPFRTTSIGSLIDQIVSGDRPRASDVNPLLPQRADPILQRGLAKSPADRYPSCGHFVAALEQALIVKATRAAVWPRPAQPALPVAIVRPPSGIQPRYWISAVALLSLIAAFATFKLVSRIAANHAFEGAQELGISPVVNRFTVDSPGVQAGDSTTLRWTVTGANEVTITPGIGKAAASGSSEVRPNASTTYVLLASTPGGSASAKVAVDVSTRQLPPRILDFHVEPASVNLGGSFRLVWLVDGASDMSIDPEIGHVSKDGAIVMSAVSTRTFTLTATNRAGTLNSQTTIVVEKSSIPAPPPSVTAGQLYSEGVAASRRSQSDKAVKLFTRSAELGHGQAMMKLAEMHHRGEGVARSDEEAVRWFRKAADAGDSAAMDALGHMYADGTGIARDEAQAVEWYKKSVQDRNATAMYDLGIMYEEGRGIKKDAFAALDLYRKAAVAGNSKAKTRFARLQAVRPSKAEQAK